MIFAKRNIYNQELISVASHVFVHAEILANDEQLQLNEFLSAVMNDVDDGIDEFNLIIGAQYASLVNKNNLQGSEKFCLLVEISENKDTEQDLSNQFSVYLDDLNLIANLASNVDTLLIPSEILKKEESRIKEVLANYRVIATQVNEYIDFKQLKAIGLQYFEGDFIEKPEKVNQANISTNKVSILNLISTLNKENVELDEVAQVLAADNMLSYKLLKIINSPIFRGMQELTSIQDAIVRFGFANLKKWVLMLSLCNVSEKPLALIRLALTRAILCSLIAKKDKTLDPEIAYTMGLLSTLDAFIDCSIDVLLKETALSHKVKQAILMHEGDLGRLLHNVITYQRGEEAGDLDKDFALSYITSLEQANEVLSVLGMK